MGGILHSLTILNAISLSPIVVFHQVILSFENTSSTVASSATLALAHDVSADEMKEAINFLAAESLDGFVGDLHVSRESNGAEGLQSYRCIRSNTNEN